MSKAVIYLRVSTEEQAEKGFSILAQKQECIQKAVELGCTPDNIIEYCDEGVSGSILERPQLMAALDRIHQKDIAYFICFDSSRLSRNVSHQLIIIDEIKKYGTHLTFVKSNYEDNAEGRFQLTIMAAVDEYERARLRLRTELGKRTKASQHKLTHNPGLYGYNFDKITDTLNINETQAKIIQWMYQWLTEENMGPNTIAGRLNDMGIPSPKQKLWHRVTIRRILANSAYTGTLYIRRYDTKDCRLNKFKKPEEKAKVKERPREEWIAINIPPIINDNTWNQAQAILNKAKRLYHNAPKTDYLLSGLLNCGLCGSSINGRYSQKNKNGTPLRYYACSAKYKESHTKTKCSSKLINSDILEAQIWNHIIKCIINPQTLKQAEEKSLEAHADDTKLQSERIHEELSNLNKEKDKIITLYQKSFINEINMQDRLQDINIKETRLKGLLQKLNQDIHSNQEESPKIPSSEYLKILEFANRLSPQDKKNIFRLVLSELTLWDDKIKVCTKIPSLYI